LETIFLLAGKKAQNFTKLNKLFSLINLGNADFITSIYFALPGASRNQEWH
jgi:hypothetical protein